LVRAPQALGSDKCLLSRVPVAVATIVARMNAGPLMAVEAIGVQVAPAGAVVVLEARAAMAHRAVVPRLDVAALAAGRRLVVGQATMTLAVIGEHEVRVGQVPVVTPAARMDVVLADVTRVVATKAVRVGLGAQAPTAARMGVVPVIVAMGPVATVARRCVVTDA